jgi:hypothetical protein
MTNITLDIETIPSQKPGLLDEIRASIADNFKAPSDMTKERACAELGMTDANEIKFTSKARALELWADRFKHEKAEEVSQEEYKKTCFDGSQGQICVVGLAFNDADPIAIYRDDWQNPTSEGDLVAEAFTAIADCYHPQSDRRPLFIGHNITGFDLRFLFQRAVILGIKPPSIIPFHAKPWDDAVFDTMTRWAGNQGGIKLDALCKALGVGGKTEGVDGSMVWPMVQEGRIDEVADYCRGDISATYRAYCRLTFQPLPVAQACAQEVDELPF